MHRRSELEPAIRLGSGPDFCRAASRQNPVSTSSLRLIQSLIRCSQQLRAVAAILRKTSDTTADGELAKRLLVAKGKIVVFSAIDNLIKGAAGQAVQNMNIICQLPETMGLL